MSKDTSQSQEFFSFYNPEDYEEESVIGEGASTTVKVVHNKNQEKFAKKELKQVDTQLVKRFISEGELLFKF